MINGYTESEICSLYRQAKNKKSQIEILTQLTGVNKLAIENILKKGGYLMAEKKPKAVIDSTVPNAGKIIELHAKGLSQKQIAKEVGVAQSTMHYYFKKLDLVSNFRHPYKNKEENEVASEPREPIKGAVPHASVFEKMKEDTQKNVEKLKAVLPQSTSDPEDLPIDYQVVEGTFETLTPQQYYELAKLTLELIKTIWEG